MRVIVSGGGTGGHIYPAITLIRAIQSLRQDCEFLYVGTKKGLEADIVPKEGLDFRAIKVSGFSRSLSPGNLKTVCEAGLSVLTARSIVKEFKPDLAIGTGGYVCGPILLAAALMSIPTLVQEQNVIPGVTNRILARFVTRVAAGYEDAVRRFPSGKAVFTGNPIRSEVMEARRADGQQVFGLAPNRFTVLISGGSRGARSINRAMIDVHRHFAGDDTIQLLHVTGKNEYNDIDIRLQAVGIDWEKTGNIKLKPYLYDMPKALAAADAAVFRAGAIGLAELTAKGVPAVLVPYPYAAENHQEYNALALQNRGAAFVIRDAELTADKIIERLTELKNSPERRCSMAEAARALGRPEAAMDIARMALELAENNL